MAKKLYMAYGSNLSVEQMATRCPDARIIGKAVLKDWKLVFKLHADIEPCVGCEVPVLIWKISAGDEHRLDQYEGYPFYYRKQEIPVTMTDLKGNHPRKVSAMVYTMTDGRDVRMPMKGYWDVLDEGYTRFGFDRSILRNALRNAKEAEEDVFS